MNRIFLRTFLAAAILIFIAQLRAAEIIPLAGEWRFALDRNDAGTNENWFAKNLPDKIQLPGILEAQGYGDEISTATPWVLSLYDHFWFLCADYAACTNAGSVKIPFLCQPPRHYLGAAWYQRDFEIPTNWSGKRAVLFLERPHWKSTVWLDDREIGSDISLCTPHEFDFSLVPPGSHRVSIRVDNRMILPYRPDAHSISDSLDDAWNGIVGKIELRATSPVWIEDVQVFPNLEKKSVTAKIKIGNLTGKAGSGTILFACGTAASAEMQTLEDLPAISNKTINWDTNGKIFNLEISLENLSPQWLQWDEFHPNLRDLFVGLMGSSIPDFRHVVFGLRDLHADGNQFILNGRPVYIRGTHFGGDFPLTGYPPTDVASWKKIFTTCKDWGLNSMRFHSWCPPEAAFDAADELGFYLYVEPGMWNTFNPGSPMEAMLYSETGRIIKAYGNHPSFLLFSPSNEPKGRWQNVLPPWAAHFRAADPRRLYTSGTGFTDADAPGPLDQVDFTTTGRFGGQRVRGEPGWFGRDYSRALDGVKVPVIAHELGQWIAYPDFDVIKKFTGFMQPGNYEIFRDSAAAHDLFDTNETATGRAGSPLPAAHGHANDGAHGVTRPTNKDFAWASGRFQLECYKEEIEANLRTPGLSGFQLLDLHDYTGQGSAFVGLLDPFWESKGCATPDEFKKFCNTVVPLARLTKRVFTTADSLEVPVEVANFGSAPLTNVPCGWEIMNSSGYVVANGSLGLPTIPLGKNFTLGKISADLSKLPAPAAYKLIVEIENPPFANDWNFWLYPAQISNSISPDVFVTSSWDDAEEKLAAGGKVLFLPRNADLDWTSPPLARVPVFWNALMGPTWSRMLGLWCDTNSAALAEFPTEENCDWQWTELLHNTRAVNLDKLPRGLTPVVSAIDDWNRNYKLGLIFEAKVGAGKLLVCSADLNAPQNPVARQLRRSLLDYMAGEKFRPQTEISTLDFRSLYFDNRIMPKLGATAEADGQNANSIVDGDPNTFWLSGEARGNGSRQPHEIKILFPQSVAMNGLVLMPRQNQREHQGDIRDYTVQASDDGTAWREIARGQLASTFEPQKVWFGKMVTAKELKLTAASGFGNDTPAALAELAVIYAGPKLAENSGGMEYQRVRTASPDIDAGADVSGKPPKSKAPSK